MDRGPQSHRRRGDRYLASQTLGGQARGKQEISGDGQAGNEDHDAPQRENLPRITTLQALTADLGQCGGGMDRLAMGGQWWSGGACAGGCPAGPGWALLEARDAGSAGWAMRQAISSSMGGQWKNIQGSTADWRGVGDRSISTS